MTTLPDQSFSKPWHARLFVMTLALHEEGHFSWLEWSERLGQKIEQKQSASQSNIDDQYFDAWRQVLEDLLEEMQI